MISNKKYIFKKKPSSKFARKLKVEKDYGKLLGLIAIAITALVFSNSLNNDFVANWDDNVYILNSNLIRDLSTIGIQQIFTTFYAGNYHPFTTLTYALEFKFFGLNPQPYHFANYILHLLNVLLVFILIKKITGKNYFAFWVSLLFGIHPMHVESVSWISERKDLLFSLFFFGSLIFYLRYAQNGQKFSNILLAFLLFTASCFSKSMAVSLPIIMLLLDFYLKRDFKLQTFIEKLPFFAISVTFGIIAILSQKASGSIYYHLPFDWVDRFFLVSYSLSFYLVKLFLPFNLSITHFYPDSASLLPLEFYLSPVLLALIAVLVLKSGKLRHGLIFGLLFYIVTISLVIQLVPVGQFIVAERYSYIPYIGLFFMIVLILNHLYENKPKLGKKLIFVLALYILIFSVQSYQRNKVWKNGIILFSDAIDKNPDQGMLYSTRGNDYLTNKQFSNAIIDFNEAIKLMPNFADAYHNRGVSRYNMNDKTGAIEDYTKVIALQPKNPNGYYSRGLAFYDIGNNIKAIEDYSKVIELADNYIEVYNNRGVSKGVLQDYEGSIKDFDKAILNAPKNPNAWFNRGNSLLMLNRLDKACADYKKASELGSDEAKEMYFKYCKSEVK